MNRLITFTLLLFACSQIFAQGIICVQGKSSDPIFVTTFAAALDSAKDGDYLYLPGGMTINGSYTINKRLNIFGAGYHPNYTKAAGATYITGIITLETGANGSLFVGINMSGYYIIVKASNVSVSRCLFTSIQIQNNPNNISLSENVVSYLYGNGITKPILVSNNIIYYNIQSFNNGQFVNNIFTRNANDYLFYSVQNVRFDNNIVVLNNKTYLSTNSYNNIFNNNLFVLDSQSVTSTGLIKNGTNNIYGQNKDSIFTNYDGNDNWNTKHDFHLKSTCSGVNAGTDSTDVGIYGSATPFKEGGVPFNPQFQSFFVPTSSNSEGKLPIKIKVQGQSR